jgi:ferric-dicitrate binding protein FerR (iron transport regulator)
MDHEAAFIESNPDRYSDLSAVQSANMLAVINKRIRIKKTRRIYWQVAAALIPLILVVGLTIRLNSQVNLFGKTVYSEVYVPKGKQEHIIFQDGSEAYLNSDTRLRYPRKFGLSKREIFLQGEGYFNIATNKRRPFIVRINNTDVTVLGTSFNVHAFKEDNEMKILLDKGSIVFNTPQNSYQILPGQQAVYDVLTGKCVIDYVDKPYEVSVWKDNIVLFRDTPLADVIKTLNRRYNVEFAILNPKALTYTYTLTTNQTSLENIVKELEKIAPVKFSIRKDNSIIVSLK